MLGIVVGLRAEAGCARPLRGLVGIGGGGREGAQRAAEALARRGVSGLLSFGLAGGLDPMLPPGAVLLPNAVLTGGRRHACDAAMVARLGGPCGTGTLYGGVRVVAEMEAKARLFRETGAGAVDLESGAVALVAAAHKLPFAVLRVVCDPAARDLPPAALAALDARGAIGLGRVALSVLRRPGQLPALLRLADEARAARAALVAHVRTLDEGD